MFTIATNLTLNEIRDGERRRRRETGNSLLESLESLSVRERETPYATSLKETDAAQVEAERYLVRQLLRLLQGKDREVIAFMHDEFTTQEIAEAMDTTPDAIQKRLERIRKWLIPIARNLDALINCLPSEKDRKIMERYLDGQSLSEIAKAIVGISRSKVEETVGRVIKQWKKAAADNPTDPVSTMVK